MLPGQVDREHRADVEADAGAVNPGRGPGGVVVIVPLDSRSVLLEAAAQGEEVRDPDFGAYAQDARILVRGGDVAVFRSVQIIAAVIPDGVQPGTRVVGHLIIDADQASVPEGVGGAHAPAHRRGHGVVPVAGRGVLRVIVAVVEGRVHGVVPLVGQRIPGRRGDGGAQAQAGERRDDDAQLEIGAGAAGAQPETVVHRDEAVFEHGGILGLLFVVFFRDLADGVEIEVGTDIHEVGEVHAEVEGKLLVAAPCPAVEVLIQRTADHQFVPEGVVVFGRGHVGIIHVGILAAQIGERSQRIGVPGEDAGPRRVGGSVGIGRLFQVDVHPGNALQAGGDGAQHRGIVGRAGSLHRRAEIVGLVVDEAEAVVDQATVAAGVEGEHRADVREVQPGTAGVGGVPQIAGRGTGHGQ